MKHERAGAAYPDAEFEQLLALALTSQRQGLRDETIQAGLERGTGVVRAISDREKETQHEDAQ
ncbi:MAG: hypothetical protein ACLP1Y_14330 [Candidatus Acidiferrales bacterium]